MASVRIANLVCDGNSLTRGQGASSSGGLTGDGLAYPQQLRRLLGDAGTSATTVYWSVKNIGVSGATTQERNAAWAAEGAIHYSARYCRNIVAFFEVRNDATVNDIGLEACIANVKTYVGTVRASGFQTLLVTPTFANNNPYNPLIAGYHAWLASADGRAYSDIPYLSTAYDPRLADPANATYFSDGLHLTNAGYAVVAELMAAHILGA